MILRDMAKVRNKYKKKKEQEKLRTMHIWPESRTFEAKLRHLVNGTVNCSRFPFSSSINYKSGTAAV